MDRPGTDDRFKVIIVGAGVAGLTLAHAFDKAAGIDYVVLDKHPVAPAWGSSISMYTNGARILDQLGLYDVLVAKAAEMQDFHLRGSDGKTHTTSPFLKVISDRGGYLAMTLERRVFLQTLYDELPDKSKVVEHARVSSIVEESSRVKVVLADGAVHEGDIVIGCDGIHSAVRELMWERAHRLCPGLITVAEKQRIAATYTCITGIAPYQHGLGADAVSAVSHDGFSFLFLTQPDHIYFFLFIKMPHGQVSKYPNRLRFTEADAEAEAARFLDCPVSETLVFGDVWKTRTRGVLVALDEGVLSHWFLGRTVLCGDSAHKVTPNGGFGGNLAMESAVVLANEVYAAVQRRGRRPDDEKEKKPGDEDIRLAFQNYQESHTPRVKRFYYMSWAWTRMQAYEGWGWYVMQRWILPVLFVSGAKQVAMLMASTPKLSFVPFDEHKGELKWAKQKWDLLAEEKKKKNDNEPQIGSSGASIFSKVLIALIAISALMFYTAGVWYLGRGVKAQLNLE
ncbi:FAD-dependent monooxygenase [Apiospora rasikravindrae]|uniref:FAD-dependent monooxygenase n=1 Tax=Apiospora rasikravindrae TaxID=990691 RepID=A0ABR1TCF1_9PEZI